MKNITIYSFGGLGNQLFQYCFAKNISQLRKEKVIVDISYYLLKKDRQYLLKHIVKEDCNIKFKSSFMGIIKLMIVSKTKGKKNLIESNAYKYEKDISKNYSRYVGYWQNIKYLKNLDNKIFLESKILENPIKEILDRENTVSIHIRRGDYLNKNVNNGVLSKEYYKSAIGIMNKMLNNPFFLVFSDDIEYVKNNDLFKNYYFIDNSIKSNIYPKDILEFLIMTECKNFIIANSTFSWWAAYLGKSSNKIVVAPKKWIKNVEDINLFPKEWIVI